MSLHVQERQDGSFALFIDGDLQFDSRDEALYHESLALPALTLAARRADGPLRVLICGGGDGLAARECLRFPGVAAVDLVDYDARIVDLARTRFAELNAGALWDPRASVHVEDAWRFVPGAGAYDVAICDFTVPRSVADARVLTVEWYRLVAGALSPHGVAAVNGVSPDATPEAFWCLRKTIRAAGLSALPYRVCIPSFRAQGYGPWGFFLASRDPLTVRDLSTLSCPVGTRQTDLSRLWRGARFSRTARAIERRVPAHTLAEDALVRLLLNPGRLAAGAPPAHVGDAPYDLSSLLAAIPTLHPYHTRDMVETLARQVLGAVRAIDLRRLVDHLLRRAAELPRDLVSELKRLKRFLSDAAARIEECQQWTYRVFAALVITMVLANTIAPDNAFAKGAHGLGHASASRGYSGGFGGGHGLGLGGAAPSAHVSGGGFRSSYGRSGFTDVHGYVYRPRIFVFHSHSYHTGYYSGSTTHVGGRPPAAPQPEQHKALFAADDDMIVLDNGDVVVTLSDKAYLLASQGTLQLMSTQTPEPLFGMYPDPNLFANAATEIMAQRTAVQREIGVRRDWLGWVGWTSALFPVIADDKVEVRNMEDLATRLKLASDRLGTAPRDAKPAAPSADSVELFVGCHLLPDGRIALRSRDRWYYTDGKTLTADGAAPKPCARELAAVLRDVMVKLQKELVADTASDRHDLTQMRADLASLEKDLKEYRGIQAANPSDPTYEVDYGTESIGVSDAISRTQRDIQQQQSDIGQADASAAKSERDGARIGAALATFPR